MTETARLVCVQEQGVCSITLNRPDKRNAIDSLMIEQLLEALEHADLDATVRVVVLRGSGKDFCAGMDLAELLGSADRAVAENRDAALRFTEVFLRMRRMPKPVLAAVQGRALAGGAGLATAADLVLAQRSAQFGYPEVQRGFVPAIVLTLLKRAVGEKMAFDLATTGRILTAGEAAACGLVSRVIDDDAFDTQVRALCAALAGTSASALALTKQQFYELDGLPFEEGLRLGADVNAVSRTTPDFRSAIAAFLKK
ncbi:MAG TPA: enoyl-CoA hydratase/isomerase family protein [Gemmatimonadales bacterium]|nr:enoyl-CoA hydratase/isomerase family protein [Gemmatimonadales bacterium]